MTTPKTKTIQKNIYYYTKQNQKKKHKAKKLKKIQQSEVQQSEKENKEHLENSQFFVVDSEDEQNNNKEDSDSYEEEYYEERTYQGKEGDEITQYCYYERDEGAEYQLEDISDQEGYYAEEGDQEDEGEQGEGEQEEEGYYEEEELDQDGVRQRAMPYRMRGQDQDMSNQDSEEDRNCADEDSEELRGMDQMEEDIRKQENLKRRTRMDDELKDDDSVTKEEDSLSNDQNIVEESPQKQASPSDSSSSQDSEEDDSEEDEDEDQDQSDEDKSSSGSSDEIDGEQQREGLSEEEVNQALIKFMMLPNLQPQQLIRKGFTSANSNPNAINIYILPQQKRQPILDDVNFDYVMKMQSCHYQDSDEEITQSEHQKPIKNKKIVHFTEFVEIKMFNSKEETAMVSSSVENICSLNTKEKYKDLKPQSLIDRENRAKEELERFLHSEEEEEFLNEEAEELINSQTGGQNNFISSEKDMISEILDEIKLSTEYVPLQLEERKIGQEEFEEAEVTL